MPSMTTTSLRRFLAAGFGSGLIPRRIWGSDNGAGTVGAVLAAVIAVLLAPFPEYVHLAAVGVAIALSLWAPTPFLETDGDPQWVAIDEVAGTLIALTGLAGLPWIVAWLVFRAADIWKVLPGVPQAERLPGAIGVTADDVVAGLYGLAAGSLLTLVV
jgi:phosphatidylglycerophosphatase A